MRRAFAWSSTPAAALLGLSLILTASSCHEADAATDVARKPAAETQSHDDDSRDQYALAHAIMSAQRSDDVEGSLARTRSEWIGRRYRWEVALVPALCSAAAVGPCVVMPFDHGRDPEHSIHQGWLPKLDLSPDERSALLDACEAHRRCVIELSGTLRKFELSTERPTSLTLADVEVHGTRAATDDESWIRSGRQPKLHRKGLRKLAP